jgi:hypothetical protein
MQIVIIYKLILHIYARTVYTLSNLLYCFDIVYSIVNLSKPTFSGFKIDGIDLKGEKA